MVAADFLVDSGNDAPPLVPVHDSRRLSGQIGLNALLEVKSELCVCNPVGVPIATTGHAGNVEPSFNIVEPDPVAPGVPGIPPSGSDVDGAVPFQGLLHCFIHVPLPSIPRSVGVPWDVPALLLP